MHLPQPAAFLRLTAISLAGSFVAGACSSWSLELATVPETPPPARPVQVAGAAPIPSSAMVPTPRPVPTAGPAAATTPRPTAAPTTAPAAKPRPARKPDRGRASDVTVIRLKPRPAPGPFELNLYREGDFVHQATKDWCVAGSTQIMMNIIDSGRPNRSVAFQERLYLRGRALSPNKAKLGAIGVDLTGWAELLNTNGYGPYVVEASETRRGAIRKAARALRLTGRPVGLVTWRGAHSWVMSGFTATADPAYSGSYQVKAIYVQDTWYPSVSTIWGASDPPDTLVPMARLKQDYLPYVRPRAKYPKRDGKFMLILPVLPRGTVAR